MFAILEHESFFCIGSRPRSSLLEFSGKNADEFKEKLKSIYSETVAGMIFNLMIIM